MASCIPQDESASANAAPVQKLTTIGCLQPDLCECTPLVGGTRALESGTAVNLEIPLGANGTALKTYGADWATGEVVGNNLTIKGTAPTGKQVLVFELANDCSKACVILEIDVSEPCTSAVNKTQHLTYITGVYKVEKDVDIPEGSAIISSVPESLTAEVYGSVLNLSGTLTSPYPSDYLVTLSSPCGQFTVSGQIAACTPPAVESITGPSVLENGVSAEMTWVLSGTGPMTTGQVTGVPPGMTASITNNSPAGKTTVTVQGTPTENPCTATSCEISIAVAAACGNITLKRKYTQQPCRTIKVGSAVGNKVFEYEVAGSVGKIISGYTPMSISDFETPPLGLEFVLVAGPGPNEYTVTLEGAPEKDPCTDYSKEICECVKVKVTNPCGDKEIELCYAIKPAEPPKPAYCVLIAEVIPVTGVPGVSHQLTVWGGAANSVVTIRPPDRPPTDLTLDVDGYGQTTYYTDGVTAGCVTLEHPTCAIIMKEKVIVSCSVVPDPI